MAPRQSDQTASKSTSGSSSTRPRSTRFRFKAPHRTPKPFAHKSHSRSTSPDAVTDDREPAQAEAPKVSHSNKNAGAETPFAESLFDALSDPENAAYWAAVYGQPIHIYSRPYVASARNASGFEPVSDEEYVQFVQAKMWEKTREGVEEGVRTRARRRAEEERLAQEERVSAAEERRREGRRKMKEKERRAAEVRIAEDQAWIRSVREYLDAWTKGTDIPWPTMNETGPLKEDGVEVFLEHLAKITGESFANVIKAERLRWHPDKILQKFGAGSTPEERKERMQRVNELWRIIDTIWRRVKD